MYFFVFGVTMIVAIGGIINKVVGSVCDVCDIITSAGIYQLVGEHIEEKKQV